MKTIITGGAGFIGCNAAARVLGRGDEVVVIDNLSRPGAAENMRWLRNLGLKQFHCTDLRDTKGTQKAFAEHHDAALVLHLAGQVAVTTSGPDPRLNFQLKSVGPFTSLEPSRPGDIHSPLLY